MRWVAGIEAFRAICDGYIDALNETKFVQQGEPRFCRNARVHRGFQHHNGVCTARQGFEDRTACSLDVGQIRFEVMRHWGGHGHQDHVAMRDGLGG